MNRRNFLRMMIGGVAAAAAERAFPFRVYSFPSDIALAHSSFAGFPEDWALVQPMYDFYLISATYAKQTLFHLPQAEEGPEVFS